MSFTKTGKIGGFTTTHYLLKGNISAIYPPYPPSAGVGLRRFYKKKTAYRGPGTEKTIWEKKIKMEIP